MRRFARLICLSLFAFILLSFLLGRHQAQKSFTSMTGNSWSSNTHLSVEQDKSSSVDSHATDSSSGSTDSNVSPHGGYDAPSHDLPSEEEIVLDDPEDSFPVDHSTGPSRHNEQVANAHSPDRDSDLTEDLVRPFPGRPNPDNEFGSEEEKNIAAGLGLLPLPQTAVKQTATYQLSPTTAANDAAGSAAATPTVEDEDEAEEEDEEESDSDYYYGRPLRGDRVHHAHPVEITPAAPLAQAAADDLNRYTESASRTTADETTATAGADESSTTDSYRSEEGKSQEELFVQFVHNLESLQSEASARTATDAADAAATAAAAVAAAAAGAADDPRADLLN